MKCEIHSKAPSNFTPNPRRHFFASLCQILLLHHPGAAMQRHFSGLAIDFLYRVHLIVV